MTTNSGSAWTNVSTTGTTQTIRSIFFTSPTTGYFTADGGIIKMTTDGGTTWTDQFNPLFGFFQGRSAWFTDANNGYISGMDGKILRTADGGSNWSEAGVGSDEDINSITFTTANVGYAVGNSGAILKTTDAGATWWPADSNITSKNLAAVQFVNINRGYAVGANGTVIKTDNGATGVSETPSFSADLKAYPNPFSESVNISYKLEQSTEVSISLYDVTGRQVFTSNKEQQAGAYLLQIDRNELQLKSGIYFLRLSTTAGSSTVRLVVN
jgi:hypothetical protein